MPKRKLEAAIPDLDEQLAAANHRSTVDEARAFMETHEITIHDPLAPLPCLSLPDAPFPAPLVKLLTSQGFASPSAVQAASWPVATLGRDVLAIAKTGSGKTLGYLLPALAKCHQVKTLNPSRNFQQPICLVMAPTRELALQICERAQHFGKAVDCRAVAVYGGSPKWSQAQELELGCEIVVATPGRMMDMLDMHGTSYTGAATSLDDCAMLILDEADRMLDMGFERDIRSIEAVVPDGHQTLLFTATWPKTVQKMADDLLFRPVKVTVGSGGEKLTASKNVEQRVHVITGKEKRSAFLALLQPLKPGGPEASKKVIVFCNTKKEVNRIAVELWEDGYYAVDTISGDREQADREATIARFRSGEVTMVIATDVAARGLDISGIDRVINYDYPSGEGGSDDYIHRIGRTGRAAAKGAADTLFTPNDMKHAKELARILEDAQQRVPPELLEMATKTGRGDGAGKGKGGGKHPNHRKNRAQ